MPRPKANIYRKYFVYEKIRNSSKCIVETDNGQCGRQIKGDHATNLTHHIKCYHKHLVVVQSNNPSPQKRLRTVDTAIHAEAVEFKCDASESISLDNGMSYGYIDPPIAILNGVSSKDNVPADDEVTSDDGGSPDDGGPPDDGVPPDDDVPSNDSVPPDDGVPPDDDMPLGDGVLPNDGEPQLQYTNAVVSKPAPLFTADAVINKEIVKLSLKHLQGRYVVLLFYAMDFSYVCPTEIIAYSDRNDEFQLLNAQVIAISVDSSLTHLAWINTPRKDGGLEGINIPLVSDMSHRISKDYGIYLDECAHAMRGLFIVDQFGVLRHITINDLRVGRSVNETLRLLKAFQYTDKHIEDCPADWIPGADTVVPHPIYKMEYFKRNH